jgi:hypothetical protein
VNGLACGSTSGKQAVGRPAGGFDLDPEKRSCSTAESEKRTPEVREAEFARQMSALKTERPVGLARYRR